MTRSPPAFMVTSIVDDITSSTLEIQQAKLAPNGLRLLRHFLIFNLKRQGGRNERDQNL